VRWLQLCAHGSSAEGSDVQCAWVKRNFVLLLVRELLAVENRREPPAGVASFRAVLIRSFASGVTLLVCQHKKEREIDSFISSARYSASFQL
jgi:hypothetical protein